MGIFVALASSGMMRVYPYTYNNVYPNPHRCLIQSREADYCEYAYKHSKCYSDTYDSYPSYDPRCRYWYDRAVHDSLYRAIIFTPPYYDASTGESVITLSAPIFQDDRNGSSTLWGVMGLDVSASKLLASIVSDEKLFPSAYIYLIDAINVSIVWLHPALERAVLSSRSVPSLRDLEPTFTDEEYDYFVNNVLQRFTNISFSEAVSTTFTYNKNGVPWVLMFTPVDIYFYFQANLIYTVPLKELTDSSRDIGLKLSEIENNFLIVIFCSISGVFVFFCLYSYKILSNLIRPINELHAICEKVCTGDLNFKVPEKFSSFESMHLLQAFGNIFSCFNIGMEYFVVGRLEDAKNVYEESLKLFTLTNISKGIGVSNNNLGIIDIILGYSDKAEKHFMEAIHNAENILDLSETAESVAQSHSLLSDRLGNIAIMHISRSNYVKAIHILNSSIKTDLQYSYWKGYVIKLGMLGHCYYLLNKNDMGEKIFKLAYEEVYSETPKTSRSKFTSLPNYDESEYFKIVQTVLCNLAYAEEKSGRYDSAEALYLKSLSRVPYYDKYVSQRAFKGLKRIFLERGKSQSVEELETLLKLIEFQCDYPLLNVMISRGIVFAFDFGATFPDNTLDAIIDSVQWVFSKSLCGSDYFGTTACSTDKCDVAWDVTRIKGTESEVLTMLTDMRTTYEKGSHFTFTLQSCQKAGVSPSLIDLVHTSISLLTTQSYDNCWILLVTDLSRYSTLGSLSDIAKEELGKQTKWIIIVLCPDSDGEHTEETIVLGGSTAYVVKVNKSAASIYSGFFSAEDRLSNPASNVIEAHWVLEQI